MSSKEDVEALKAIQQAARQTQIIRGGFAVPPEEIAAEQVRRFRQLTSPPPPPLPRTLGSPEDRKGRVKPRRIPVVHDAAPNRKPKKGLSLEAILGKLQGAPFGKFVEGGYRTSAAIIGAQAGPIPMGALLFPAGWFLLRIRFPNMNNRQVTTMLLATMAAPFGPLVMVSLLTQKLVELGGGAAGDVVAGAAAIVDCMKENRAPDFFDPLYPAKLIIWGNQISLCAAKKLGLPTIPGL